MRQPSLADFASLSALRLLELIAPTEDTGLGAMMLSLSLIAALHPDTGHRGVDVDVLWTKGEGLFAGGEGLVVLTRREVNLGLSQPSFEAGRIGDHRILQLRQRRRLVTHGKVERRLIRQGQGARVGRRIGHVDTVRGARGIASAPFTLGKGPRGSQLTRIMDPRYGKLADVLCGFSTRLKKGESVLIDAHDVPEDFVIALIRAARERGATPMVNLHKARIGREMVKGGSKEQFKLAADHELARMKKMQAYIAVRGSDNIFEGSDIPASQAKLNGELMRPVLDHRVNKTKWVVLRWPTSSMAQQAKMSTEAFADFYFRVCTLDYSRMVPGMEALKQAMMKTDEVHITGQGTDLKFNIKGMNAIPCGGEYNIPDGEVFTAPIKDSVNGVLQYNCATIYQGVSFENIRLVFRKGKIVEATANNTKRLNEILDTDGGARFIGEFAIAFNPHILNPMQDILFDEKIAGSFHFTPGKCYETTDNGNHSSIHWDMVCIQRPEYGGGEIRFDGQVIRKDGLFLPKPLQKLNPAYLLGKAK